MWRPGRIRPGRLPKAEGQAPPASLRDRLAVMLAVVTVVCLGAAFFLSKGMHVLMPGPLASAHGAIEDCSACHTKSGSGKLSFLHGLVAGDPLADSKACLTCHKMPDTAFNAHGASSEALKQSTERLTKIAAQTPQPQSARAQNIAFPTHHVLARDLYCATCHHEHQGVNFKLNKISNEQCRSCHVVKFDSFDGHHPKFENYPFKRRTRIVYDHAGHFGKHFPEVAKKDPAKRIPDTCSTCHNSREDKRVMAVAPFEQTCTGCHLDQIVGKERASGPKGIAFLTVPGLDLATLKKKNASVGEWPEDSEAALTPFMKMMISRNDRGRALVKTVDSLNLQDLTGASNDQIKAVASLVWEIKGLFYALIKGKASDVLGDFNIGGGAKLSAALVADLTASIPRDVVVGAQQQWLPNLAAEMANRPVTSDQDQSGWSTTTESSLAGSGKDKAEAAQPEGAAGEAESANTESDGGEETLSAEKSSSSPPTESGLDGSDSSENPSGSDASEATPSLNAGAVGAQAAGKGIRNEQDCTVSVFGQCVLSKGGAGQTDAANAKPDGAGSADAASKADANAPADTPAGSDTATDTKDAEKAGQPEGAGEKIYTTNAGPDDGSETPSADESGGVIIRRMLLPGGTPRSIKGGGNDAEKAAQPEGAAGETEPANAKADGDKDAPSAADPPRASKARSKDAEKATQPDGAAGEIEPANAKADGGKETPSAGEQPQNTATGQSDDLLFPTEEELRAMKTRSKDTEKAASPEGAGGKTDRANARPDAASRAGANAPAGTPAGSDTAAAEPQATAAPVISIESDVDPESWAEYGGWYRQDHAIFYRPTGHKDKFNYSWLFLTGPQAPKGDASPAAAVFDFLTGKDAQGSCTKCHSIDDIQGRGRVVNFSPPSVESKRGRFTNFIHEPHFGVLEKRGGTLENRGCLTCHSLEKERPYLKSYEQGNPQNFASNFSGVEKDLCQSCHTSSMARQDCLLCHKYHVNGVVTPIINTRIPAE